MLIASPLGQTVTPAEVATEIMSRGYYPLITTPAITPSVTPPVITLRYTVDTPPVPVPIPPIPTLPIPPIITWPEPVPIDPYITPSNGYDPSITMPVIDDDETFIEWTRITAEPLEFIIEPSLPDSPRIDWPSLTTAVTDTEIPQVIVDDFPGLPVLEWEVLTEPPPVSPLPIEFPPEKKFPWLIIVVVGAVLLLGGEKKPKRPQKRLPERRPELMRREYGI